MEIHPMTAKMDLLNEVKANSPRFWDDESFDAPTFYTAMEGIREKKPRGCSWSLGRRMTGPTRGTMESFWNPRIAWTAT